MSFGTHLGKAATLDNDELKTTTFDDFSGPTSQDNMFRNLAEQECSMCGDVGFSAELFQCTKCLHRLQHTYCTRGYPDIASKELICDWCHSEESKIANDKLRSKRKLRRTEIEWHQYKDIALELLLEVAQQAGEGENKVGELVKNQVNCSKATTLNHPETKRHRCETKESYGQSPEKWKCVTKKKLPLSAPSKGIGRRYKLLSDVLC